MLQESILCAAQLLNELKELEYERKGLRIVLNRVANNQPITVSFHTTGSLYTVINNLDRDFSRYYISTLINQLSKNIKEIEEKIKAI